MSRPVNIGSQIVVQLYEGCSDDFGFELGDNVGEEEGDETARILPTLLSQVVHQQLYVLEGLDFDETAFEDEKNFFEEEFVFSVFTEILHQLAHQSVQQR